MQLTQEENGLSLRIGALCPKIATQLMEQGHSFNEQEIKHIQKDADSINRLYVRGYLMEGAATMLRRKIYYKVAKHISTFKS